MFIDDDDDGDGDDGDDDDNHALYCSLHMLAQSPADYINATCLIPDSKIFEKQQRFALD